MHFRTFNKLFITLFGDFNSKFFSCGLLNASVNTCMGPFSNFLFQVISVWELALNIFFLDHSNLTENFYMSFSLERHYSFGRTILNRKLFLLVLIEFKFKILLNSNPILPNFLVRIDCWQRINFHGTFWVFCKINYIKICFKSHIFENFQFLI